MRKNRMMRLASALLILTMVTTCAISGTFAKYVTSDSATDTARVAKWGVSVMASGDLFGTDYNPNSTEDSLDDDVIGTVKTSVSSSNANKIVAPGTQNDVGYTISIAGTPEVAWDVTATTTEDNNKDIYLGEGYWAVMVEATGLNAGTNIATYYEETDGTYKLTEDTAWTSGKTYYEMHDAVNFTGDYYPLQWTVTTTGAATALTNTHLKEMTKEIVDNLSALAGDANDSTAASYKLTWKWQFEVDDATNVKDTILGNLQEGTSKVVYSSNGTSYAAATAEHYCLDVSFNMAVTVSQVD